MTCKCGRPMQHEYGIWWRCDRCGDWDMLPMEEGEAPKKGAKPPLNVRTYPARPHAVGRQENRG